MMNLFTASTGLGSHSPGRTKSIFAGGLPVLHNSTLKSAQDKAERQQKATNEIAFWENQKENLKNRECDTVEEIAQKLKAFHSYEDEIAAVKSAYNNEQMGHILDEAQEQGEKNAEAAKKQEPKTPEERREEMAEEALGTEDEESVLDEMLDAVTEAAEETLEEQEEILEEAQEQMLEETAQEFQEQKAAQPSQSQGLEEAIQLSRQQELDQSAQASAQQGLEQAIQEFQEKSLEEAAEISQENKGLQAATESYSAAKAAGWEKYHRGLDFRI